jgi:hypothetical protein
VPNYIYEGIPSAMGKSKNLTPEKFQTRMYPWLDTPLHVPLATDSPIHRIVNFLNLISKIVSTDLQIKVSLYEL